MLKITNLTKEYNNIKAVDSFNVFIEKGHIYGVVGPNGAGKTTFFKMLAGTIVTVCILVERSVDNVHYGVVQILHRDNLEVYHVYDD